MKKAILFLLLLSITAYGQADFPEGISLSGNGPTTSITKLISQEPSNGNLNYINANRLPFIPKSNSVNYDVADSNTTITGTTFDAFGILVQSLSNKIFMIYREGAGHVSNDGKIVMRSSTDGGKTFSSRTIIHQEVAGIDCRNIAGGVTASGRIIIFFLKQNNSVPTFYSQGIMYSDDDAVTWSTYAPQTYPAGSSGGSPYGNMITIAGGRVAIPYYSVLSDGSFATYLKFSDDNGSTWGGDVLVGSDLTNGFNEASYAYLDGGVIVCVSRKKDTLLLRQFISLDNGQTWTSQGDIPSSNASNVAPWLNVYTESSGEKYVALFTSLRGVPQGVNGVVASKTAIITGSTGWLSETRQVLTTSINSDSGYPSVINPRGGKKMLGMSYSSNSIVDPMSAIANYKFWNYTPSAVVPAMSGTTNFLQKKTGGASLTDSRIFDNGTMLGIGINTPNYNIQSHTTGNNYFQITNTNSGTTGIDGLVFGLDNAGAVQIINRENSYISFFTNNTERVRYHASGGVSIGTTVDLGVGTINASGNVRTVDAINVLDATTKQQVDAGLALKVSKSGDSMTGTLSISPSNTANEGIISQTGSNNAFRGSSTSGTGVLGASSTATGVQATSGSGVPFSASGSSNSRIASFGNASVEVSYVNNTGGYVKVGGTTDQALTAAGGVMTILSGTASLDFPSTASNAESELTITITGAAIGDVVSLGGPVWATSTYYIAYVSATNTVTVRYRNMTVSAVDPASATFKVKIFK